MSNTRFLFCDINSEIVHYVLLSFILCLWYLSVYTYRMPQKGGSPNLKLNNSATINKFDVRISDIFIIKVIHFMSSNIKNSLHFNS